MNKFQWAKFEISPVDRAGLEKVDYFNIVCLYFIETLFNMSDFALMNGSIIVMFYKGWTNESLHSVVKTDFVDVSAHAFVIDERAIYTYMIQQ